MKIEELDIEVEDVDEFNDAAGEELTAYCEGLELETSNTRKVSEEDSDCDGFSFIWQPKANKLIRNKIDELYAIGAKYFGENNIDLDISSHMFKES